MPHPGGQQAASLRLTVGAGDGADGDTQAIRQGAVGGQSGLRGQLAARDPLFDRLDQLEVEGAIEGRQVGVQIVMVTINPLIQICSQYSVNFSLITIK